ncbi:hypothetical protein [Paludibacter sp. 221]|nr:hypothetical protein [Paludibacter sp. 221]
MEKVKSFLKDKWYIAVGGVAVIAIIFFYSKKKSRKRYRYGR